MTATASRRKKAIMVLAYLAWVAGGFLAAQFVVGGLAWLLLQTTIFDTVSDSVLQTTLTGLVYALALLIVIGIPWRVWRARTTREEIGLQRGPSWFELFISPVAVVAYFICSAILISIVASIVPTFDVSEAQDVGFDAISSGYEYVLAFVALVVIAPIAEEILLRGYLYTKLKRWTKRWISIIFVSSLFGLLHMQWNVAIDTFVLSVFACLLRDWTGSLWPSIFLHMLKNGLAYYLLFINPDITSTIGN